MTASDQSLAQGQDFAVERHDDVVVCRVWIRSEVSDIEAMRMVADKAATLSTLTSEFRTALLLDLRGTRGGRIRHKRLRGIFKTWHSLDRPVSILVDDDLQKMRTERLVVEMGVQQLRVFVADADALAWALLATHLNGPKTATTPYAEATAS